MAFIDAMKKFSVFSTSDTDEAEVALGKSLVDARFTRVVGRQRFGFQLNRFDLGSVSLVGNRYEAHTEIESGASGIHHNTMHLIFGGPDAAEFSIEGTTFQVSPSQGVVLVPDRKIKVRRSAGSEILILRFTRSSLNKYYELLLDRQLSGDIDFHYGVDLTRGPGAFLKQLASTLLSGIQQDDEVIRHEFTQRSYEELLLGTMLQLPHSETATIWQRRVADIAPGSVVRAEEYMRAYLSEPITVADLLSITGCSRTALYSHFRRTRGYTPMEFLLEQRLMKARSDLTKSRLGKAISSIALDCGFSHLGRFSQLYRKRFGELPSETARGK